jgi:hypothetical protein
MLNTRDEAGDGDLGRKVGRVELTDLTRDGKVGRSRCARDLLMRVAVCNETNNGTVGTFDGGIGGLLVVQRVYCPPKLKPP